MTQVHGEEENEQFAFQPRSCSFIYTQVYVPNQWPFECSSTCRSSSCAMDHLLVHLLRLRLQSSLFAAAGISVHRQLLAFDFPATWGHQNKEAPLTIWNLRSLAFCADRRRS